MFPCATHAVARGPLGESSRPQRFMERSEAMNDFSFSPEDFSGTARLFPLPNLVLFPHVMQPLHVFEPRYRDLLEEALDDDRLVAMALLEPGWEKDYDGRPPLSTAACLGRVAVHHRLAGGAYNILLVGLRRIKLLNELPPTKTFREAAVELYDDFQPAEDARASSELARKLRETFLEILPNLPQAQDQLEQLLSGDICLGTLTDIIGYTLDIDLRHKMALLAEANVHRRAALLLEHLSGVLDDGSGNFGGVIAFPPEFSAN